MSKKILVVKNPVSASGRRQAFVNKVIDRLEKEDCLLSVYETTAAGDAISYLLDLEHSFDLVVAAGGDGTVNEVINGMIHMPRTPLALIPAGTTNVLAKELGLPRNVDGIVKVIMSGLSKSVYLARLNDRRFSMMVGVGYDAWVVNKVNLDLKKRFGKVAYVLSMLKEIFTFGQQRFVAEIDGRQVNVTSMIVTQGKYYAGSFVLSRKADLSNPYMQAIVVDTPSLLRFFLITLTLPMGLMEKHPAVKSIAAKEIRIKSVESKPDLDVLQMDGDGAGIIASTHED